jgi:hypothetical protein
MHSDPIDICTEFGKSIMSDPKPGLIDRLFTFVPTVCAGVPTFVYLPRGSFCGDDYLKSTVQMHITDIMPQAVLLHRL